MNMLAVVFLITLCGLLSRAHPVDRRSRRSIGLVGTQESTFVNKPLTDTDFENAKEVKKTSGTEVQPFTCGVTAPHGNQTNDTQNTAVPLTTVIPFMRWDERQVPYVISNEFTDYERATIAHAMQTFHDNTCIKFVNRKKQCDYIRIQKSGSSCDSLVGRNNRFGFGQDINLAPTCAESSGIVQHELMHALGFIHEHQRPDRNAYVTILWPNIGTGVYNNFLIETTVTPILSYDYGSIMHYSTSAFSWNGLPTIVPLNEAKIGRRDGLSKMDIKKLKKVYCTDNPLNILTDVPAKINTVYAAFVNIVQSALRPVTWVRDGFSCAVSLLKSC